MTLHNDPLFAIYWKFASFDPPANGALILADALGGFNGYSRKSGNWSIVPPHFPTEPFQYIAKSGSLCNVMGRMAHNRAQKGNKGDVSRERRLDVGSE